MREHLIVFNFVGCNRGGMIGMKEITICHKQKTTPRPTNFMQCATV